MDFFRKTRNHAVLAVDIGGPIIRQRGLPTEGAVEALHFLAAERFGTRIHLISQCDEETELARWRWLRTRRFFERTDVLPEHVHFCREPWQKAEWCSNVGASHFVENSITAMKHVTSVPNLYLYHPDREDVAHHPQFMQYVFDAALHPAEEANRRPILMVQEWGRTLIRSILAAPIFRHLKCSNPPPMLMP